MELRHLRYFVTVAEEKHFRRAAARLRIAQPALSRQVQALETELGFALLERTRRGVELTPAGTVFLDHAHRVFEALDLAVHEAKRASDGESGRISVGYLSSLAYTGLTELLRAYRARFPAVEVVLRQLPPAKQVEALRDGRIDVGFVRGPLDEPQLASECLRREPLVVALPEGHPLARRARVPLRLLAQEPFVVFPRHRGPAFFDLLMALCRGAGFTPHIVQEAPHQDIVSLVVAGFGVAIVPESVREMKRDGVVLRPLEEPKFTELLVAWNARNDSRVLREFLEVVRKVGVHARPRATARRARAQ